VYEIKVQQGEYQTCAGGPSFSNFVVEVNMAIFKGNCGGIMLRTDSASSKYYLFEICSSTQYGIFQYVGAQASDFKTLKLGHSSSIKTGVGQINVLAVVADGSNFTLYVNRQAVEHLSEGSYTTGRIGFIADGSNFGREAAATEVAYIDQKVWLI
jgi:hypothetical protein